MGKRIARRALRFMKNVCSQTQENFEKLKKAKVILLDLDGTVYIDYEPIDGVIASLERLRASGRKLVYLTNNSSKSYKDYEKNLRLSGIFESGDEIYTSAMATAEYLNEEKPGARVYLLAPDDVKADFRAAGVNVVESSPDVAVLAYDITLDYKKIREDATKKKNPRKSNSGKLSQVLYFMIF